MAKTNNTLGEVNNLLKTLKGFNNLIKDAPSGVRVNLYIDVFCLIFFICVVGLFKFVLAGEEMAHKGLALLGVTTLALIVFLFFCCYCYAYHIRGEYLHD